MNPVPLRAENRLSAALLLFSFACQLGIIALCVVFILPRVLLEATEQGVSWPFPVRAILEAIVLSARYGWIPLALLAGAAVAHLRRSAAARRASLIRFGLVTLVAAGTVFSSATAASTLIGCALAIGPR